jgi:predicted metal-dependent peptidase
MAIDRFEAKAVSEKIQEARNELLTENPFFAILLMQMNYGLDETIETAATDGKKIIFSPSFIASLSLQETKFVLLHEIMHVALGHMKRGSSLKDHMTSNIAADIIVNSSIAESYSWDFSKISIHGKPAMHSYKGREGTNFELSELYNLLEGDKNGKKGNEPTNPSEDGTEPSDGGSSNQDVTVSTKGKGPGKEPNNQKEKSKEPSKGGNSSLDATNEPTDPQTKNRSGKGNQGTGEDLGSQAGGKPGKENQGGGGNLDSHELWDGGEEVDQEWKNKMARALVVLKSMGKEASTGLSSPMNRRLDEIMSPTLDWKTLLQNFLQPSLYDYDYAPPSRRPSESDFIMPEFKASDGAIENIQIMIDASGSIDDKSLSVFLDEICSLISLFEGHIKGYLSYFSNEITTPAPFSSKEEAKAVPVVSSFGTNVIEAFRELADYWKNEKPTAYIFLTDGEFVWPEENAAMGVPVLWIFNKKGVKAEWGQSATMEEMENGND